jgi:hypothetical protein
LACIRGGQAGDGDEGWNDDVVVDVFHGG